MPSIDTIISAALAYLLIGSLSWFALWCSGVMHQVQVRRQARIMSRVIASIFVILLWPVIVCELLRATLTPGAWR